MAFWPDERPSTLYTFPCHAIPLCVMSNKPDELIPYNPDTLDESILWAERNDLGDGYRTIRMVINIRLNLDAFNGDKNHGRLLPTRIIVGVKAPTLGCSWE